MDPEYYNCLLLHRRKRNIREGERGREEVANSESRALQELGRWSCCSERTCGKQGQVALLPSILRVKQGGRERRENKNKKFLIGFLLTFHTKCFLKFFNAFGPLAHQQEEGSSLFSFFFSFFLFLGPDFSSIGHHHHNDIAKEE